MNRRRFTGVLLGAPAALGLTPPVFATTVRPQPIPALLARQQAGPLHGIDPADMDLTADPRNDFYRFANGGWLDRVTIPSDRSRYGVFAEIDDRTTAQLLGLLGNLAKDDALAEGSDEWKAVQLFAQGMDIETRNAQGLDPLRETLDDIQSIEDLDALHAFFVQEAMGASPDFFDFTIAPGMRQSSVYAFYLEGPPLTLPNRDYYLEESESYEIVRQ
ncbi:MAG TPA: M13 family metallopeptidase N-terminal domain-containing protein, partial [Thermomicrobiales bacterium]|nr:M13 family metallopeptidase N-terminal domain-containing protein [Thermomicrobiales bacterium]